MFSMPRRTRQIFRPAATKAREPVEASAVGDNGYSVLISPEIKVPNRSPYSTLNFDIRGSRKDALARFRKRASGSDQDAAEEERRLAA
jgi:hypothetical protein